MSIIHYSNTKIGVTTSNMVHPVQFAYFAVSIPSTEYLLPSIIELLINETLNWDLPQHYFLFHPLQCIHTQHVFYDLLSVLWEYNTRMVTDRVILRDTSTDLLQYVTISHFCRIWSCLGSSWHKPLNKLWLKENTNCTKSITIQYKDNSSRPYVGLFDSLKGSLLSHFHF